MKLRDYVGKWIYHGLVSSPLYLLSVISETNHIAEVLAINPKYSVYGQMTVYPPVKLSKQYYNREAVKTVFEGSREEEI